MNKLVIASIAMSLVISGCSTVNKSNGKIVLDSSPQRGDWINNPKLSWEENGKILLKSTHTVRGDQKLNGCYTLASMDAKENLLSEMSNEIKGAVDTADIDLNENAETILGKVRSGKFEGKIYGLKASEQYFERYVVSGTERIDCQVLSEISKMDYDKTKKEVVDKIVSVDPRIKEAILQKQVKFFADREPASQAVVKSDDKE